MKIWKPLAVASALALALTGCASSASPAGDNRLSVQVAFYPFQFIAERVGARQ